jgi:hypothetical protein
MSPTSTQATFFAGEMHSILQETHSNVAASAFVKKPAIRKIKPTEGPRPDALQVCSVETIRTKMRGQLPEAGSDHNNIQFSFVACPPISCQLTPIPQTVHWLLLSNRPQSLAGSSSTGSSRGTRDSSRYVQLKRNSFQTVDVLAHGNTTSFQTVGFLAHGSTASFQTVDVLAHGNTTSFQTVDFLAHGSTASFQTVDF